MPVRSGTPTPVSPTDPLLVRNRTPSPTRALSAEKTPQPLPGGIEMQTKLPASRQHETLFSHHVQTSSVEQVLSSSIPSLLPKQLPRLPDATMISPVQQVISTMDAMFADSNADVFTSPRSLASPSMRSSASTITAPLSPRLHGPRSPAPRQQPSPKPAIGSAHTKLRIVSGNGRRVSVGRETVPLKGSDDGFAQDPNATPTIFLSKRQHSEDHLTPRKRSPTRSPLTVREEQESRVPDPLRVPSDGMKKGQPRRLSGHSTPRRTSGQHRRVSASTASLTSQNTGTSTADSITPALPVQVGHLTVSSAVESAQKRIKDCRSGVKRLKAEIHSLRKQLNAEAIRPTSYSQSSLPRSPHRRNINVSRVDGVRGNERTRTHVSDWWTLLRCSTMAHLRDWSTGSMSSIR